MHTDAASVSCTVAPSQKTKSIEWTDPALDMQTYVTMWGGCRGGDRRDAGQVRPTSRAGRVFELAPVDDD
jgi:hypothetical protein